MQTSGKGKWLYWVDCSSGPFHKALSGKQNVDSRPSDNAVDSRGTQEHLELPNVQALSNLYRIPTSFAGFLGKYLFTI